MSDKLEQELKKALRRVEPPAGFAERVLARAAKEKAEPARVRVRWPWFGMMGMRWAVTCALCVVIAGSAMVYQHERNEKGERAKQELMLALRITSSKLQIATEGVRQINAPEQRPE
jgi:hypothetical protein